MKRLFSTHLNPNAVHFCLLLLRVGTSALVLTHGFPKFTKLLAGDMQFGDPLGIGAGLSLVLVTFAEFFCAILIILGAATRLAAIPLIINFTVIFFIVHANDPFGRKELPLLFLLIYIILLILGSGKYSVDNSISKN
jgi:putative oxidoreductase